MPQVESYVKVKQVFDLDCPSDGKRVNSDYRARLFSLFLLMALQPYEVLKMHSSLFGTLELPSIRGFT